MHDNTNCLYDNVPKLVIDMCELHRASFFGLKTWPQSSRQGPKKFQK